MGEGSWVGLDVHARSVVAGVLDAATGEVRSLRLPPGGEATVARLLRLGEITPVRIPTLAEEGARDLVRAREDARGDLMRARHRLSKLLLRHGLVYEATGWTRT
jgi:hypothetical protein